MTIDRIAKLPAVLMILGLMAAPVALTVGGPAAHAQSQEFSEQQLEAFVASLDEISAISRRMQQEINEAEDPEQVEKIRSDANQQMVQAIRQAGLDVETYNEISRTMRTDEQLAEQIQEIQKEANGSQ